MYPMDNDLVKTYRQERKAYADKMRLEFEVKKSRVVPNRTKLLISAISLTIVIGFIAWFITLV